MHPLLNTAVQAAHSAGDLIARNVNRVGSLEINSKGRNDFVTEVDRRVEQQIVEQIRKRYPGHGILGEESGRSGGSEVVWIIDPLDGTTNFIHGFPVFCVSIAVWEKGRIEHGVVYDPMRQELFTASRGQGAQLDGRKIRVRRHAGLEGTLIGTGFPYREDTTQMDAYLQMLKAVSARAAGVRRAGAAALDLAYVAAGRLDGFWELGLKAWDIAAGELLIREAGGLVGDLAGGEAHLASGHVVGGSPKVFGPLMQALGPNVDDTLRREIRSAPPIL